MTTHDSERAADSTTGEAQFPSPAVIGRLALSGSGFVFDPVSGASFSVNASGLAVLRAIQAGAADMGAIVQSLGAEFEAAPAVLERDVMEFAGRLREAFR
jgi:PqqD family protein of HPr-rel-A system